MGQYKNNMRKLNQKLRNNQNNLNKINAKPEKTSNVKQIKQSKKKNVQVVEPKQLPELFKEIQDIRYGRVKPKEEEPVIEQVKFNRIQVIDRRFNAVGAIIGILFITLFFMSLNSNYIFATSEEEKRVVGEFEENSSSLNIMNILSNNISELTKKEIITKEEPIEYETQYIENDKLPKDEIKVIQAGRLGFLDKTIINTYENGELVDENIISEVKKSNPVEEIIEIGTSEYLRDKQVHLDDIMYTIDEIDFYSEPSETAEKLGMIYQYIDLRLREEGNGWCKVSVDGIDGYVKGNLLTSENVTPGIAEKSRIKRILITVDFDMPLNSKSGLTRDDFVKVLSGNPKDKNKIFEDNAELFYDIEQKYNINGIFLASIAIHESNWGTSNIAIQKKNLFGYGAYDFSAYESATTFDSYQYGIEYVAKSLTKYYLNERNALIYDGEAAAGTYYNGPTVSGVNVRYASDTNWCNRVFEVMKALYEKL